MKVTECKDCGKYSPVSWHDDKPRACGHCRNKNTFNNDVEVPCPICNENIGHYHSDGNCQNFCISCCDIKIEDYYSVDKLIEKIKTICDKVRRNSR
tara:strand:+ start:2839 stop:3126 length:288 start_codon:yes stop_codon:yes gene_type:complete